MASKDNGSSNSNKYGPFSFVQDKWMEFSDTNRLEKLKDCQELETVVQNCLDPSSSSSSSERVALQGCKAGVRMGRFYGWLDSEYERMEGTKSGGLDVSFRPVDDQANNSSSSGGGCGKEIHGLWGCRAMALRCAPQMLLLKDCFQQYPPHVIGQVNMVAYEQQQGTTNQPPNVLNEKMPCGHLQRQLGQCVVDNATALEQRVRERRAQKKKKKKAQKQQQQQNNP